jgi:hypothetical protein
MATNIFISYRREDSAEAAARLFADLNNAFPESVFLDTGGTLKPGEAFRQGVADAIRGSDVALIVIGAQWLSLPGPDGRPRIMDPADVLHREVVHTLDPESPALRWTARRRVIPVARQPRSHAQGAGPS